MHYVPSPITPNDYDSYGRAVRRVLEGRPYLCCSTITPGADEGYGLIGIVILPTRWHSIKCIGSPDIGSKSYADGRITCREEFRTVTYSACEAVIRERADMNEWVLSDYHVAGIYIRAITAAGRDGVNFGEVFQSRWPELPIYTSDLDAFVLYDGAMSTSQRSVEVIYSKPRP